MPYRKISLLLLITVLLSLSMSSQAQDNLLQNPGFNNSAGYAKNDLRPQGSPYSFSIAPGWGGGFTKSPSTQSWMNIDPIAYPHTGPIKMEGDASQNIGRGDGTFTAWVYQTVNNIPEGTTLQFKAWAFQDSENGSGTQTRIGIGSNTGGNPLGDPIVWSDWMTAIDSWQEMTVQATVPAGSVTVFIYSTQSAPKKKNQNYYDQASLVAVGSGDVNMQSNNGQPPAPPTSTPIPFAPFVHAQPTQDNGRIVHTVQSGDTIAAIAVAYGVPVDKILSLNGLTNEQARFLTIGQQLLIREGTSEPSSTEQVAESTQAVASGSDTGFASPTVETVAQEPTSTPTDLPSNTPNFSPTPSEIPPTPTNAATAPVEQGASSDPLNVVTGICVLMYIDANTNNIQDNNESLIGGGTITIEPEAGGETITYITDTSEPHCFTDLATGLYTVRAVAPDGYGIARSSLSVSVQPDQHITAQFAAVEGLLVAAVPTVDVGTNNEQTQAANETPAPNNNLRNIAGILVLALAGVILLGGIGAAVFISRR